VLARILPHIDTAAIQDGWSRAIKPPCMVKGDIYLFLLGLAMDGADVLSNGILALQRRVPANNETKIFVIPLDLHSFDALIPNGAPDPLRAIVKALMN
jgi:hypothetical protein